MSYYNTTSLSGQELKAAVFCASNQDEAIKLIFKTGKPYTPSEIMTLCNRAGHNYLLTSCRRAITGLTNKGVLRNTGNFKQGLYGRPEGVWVLNDKQQKLF